MIDDLYENNGYEVLKRTTEKRSAWRGSTTWKCTKFKSVIPFLMKMMMMMMMMMMIDV